MSSPLFSPPALAAFKRFSRIAGAPGGVIRNRGAADSAPQRTVSTATMDQTEGEPDEATLQMIHREMSERLGPEAAASFAEFCSELGWPSAEVAVDEDRREEDYPPANFPAKDSPPSFKGMPRPGGFMAKDAALRIQRVNDNLTATDNFEKRMAKWGVETSRIGHR